MSRPSPSQLTVREVETTRRGGSCAEWAVIAAVPFAVPPLLLVAYVASEVATGS